MNNPSVIRYFGDGEKVFALTPPLIRELEAKMSCGIGEIARRILNNSYRFDDVCHTLRLGLIGGGLAPEEADRLVNHYSLAHGVLTCQLIAVDLIEALFAGTLDNAEPEPEPEPADNVVSASTIADSTDANEVPA